MRRDETIRIEQRGLWGIFESVLGESWQFIGSVKGRKCSPVVVHLLEKLRYEREGGDSCLRALEYYLQIPPPLRVCSSRVL